MSVEIILALVLVVVAVVFIRMMSGSKQSGLTDDEKARVNELFRLIDSDKNGELDMKELKVLFSSEKNLTPLKHFVTKADKDSSTGIDRKEFLLYFQDLKERKSETCLKTVLDLWLSPRQWARVWTKTAEEAVKRKQKALGLDENAVTSEQRTFLRSVFTTLDTDGSGFLELKELKDCAIAHEQLFNLFGDMDASERGCIDGKVSLDEFMAYWENLCGTVSWDVVKGAAGDLMQKKLKLKKVDYSVDKQQLIEEMGESWDRKARKLFQEMDTDQNAKLTAAEFKDWAEKNQKAAQVFIPDLDAAEGFDDLCEGFDDNMDWTLDISEFSKAYQYKMASIMLKSE